MNDHFSNHLPRERLRKVFEFLKAYSELRYPPVRDINQQLQVLRLNDLPQHSTVEVFRDNDAAGIESDEADVILRITRPDITACPSPPAVIAEWLKPGWQDISNPAEILNWRSVSDNAGVTQIEQFQELPHRSSAFHQWQQDRDAWKTRELPARQSLALFQTIYEWLGIHEREAERIEILIGDGIVSCPDNDGNFNHPVLLQRVELEFLPEKRHPQFIFRKREQQPELYLEFLRALPDANHRQIARCADELKSSEFSPLGGADTEEFFRQLIQSLFPAGGRLVAASDPFPDASPTIRRDPVIFIRQRRSGSANVFDLILEDIPKRAEFSSALLQIIGFAAGVPSSAEEEAESNPFIDEDEDILMSKPANREQMEIARQLARRDSVLVQGPPGTGKTHTIANLLGHLLAQGKRVLVTAHTPKALRVLRQKVVEPLQPLCISVLQNDKQSQEELQQSVRQIHIRLSQDDQIMEREAAQLKRDRERVIAELQEYRSRMLHARQDEIRGIVFGDRDVRPIDAAKRVKQGRGSNDWIPSPVQLGEAVPLSHAEVVALYQSNDRVRLDDERELNATRPAAETLPTPKQVADLFEEMTTLRSGDLRYREELWNDPGSTQTQDEFDRMLTLATRSIEFLRDSSMWQLEAVQAGRDGDEAKLVWVSLNELIESVWREVQECHGLVMEHGPIIEDSRSPQELLPIIDDIIRHIESGKSFGLMTKLTMPACHALIANVRIGFRRPSLESSTHFRAVRASLRIQVARKELVERWERQITVRGGPAPSELSDRPEQVCRQFVPQIQTCLDWHGSTWLALEAEFKRLGFSWTAYYEATAPETGSHAELRRLRKAVLGELKRIVTTRADWVRWKSLDEKWRSWCGLMPQSRTDAAVTQRLRQSLTDATPATYEEAYDELLRLQILEPDLVARQTLLRRLEPLAPSWASAIQNRHSHHSSPEPPGDPDAAWEWRQLHDELDRRAEVSLDELQLRIETLSRELLDVTSQLVEKRTWIGLIRKTSQDQKQALGAYAAMRNKITKTGKGVRDAELRAGARREMTVATGAVPVWIMPLNEAAETFDPRTTQFDVVIIDEASQCDPTAMVALYLGRQAIIVGDDEQVTPVSVGMDMEQVQKLIQGHLEGIPHKELYDGEFSIYEFAQIAFGGVIRLVEHFRCAPDIIAFSNDLSYKNEIKPLREATSIALSPHVLSYRVDDARARIDGVNDAEAEAIASLICAAIEQPEYAVNGSDKPVSFGVVSLVGDQQAMKINEILRQRIEPSEYKRRQLLCGDAAQFQGDERDVMFLSVVDTPPPQPPLPMRQEGPKKIFKKRFNVAASRARDQMWVVHSLNREIDLKPGDYRRRLLEHAVDPEAWERELQKRLDKSESVFEERVLKHLTAAGYRVLPRYRVGSYRIDLVVAGGGKRLAVECDGERHFGPEKLQEDADRQAILVRLGWQFVRIRGSVFFRDEERAMRPVLQRLEELGIPADSNGSGPGPRAAPIAAEVTERIVRRARELRMLWLSEVRDGIGSGSV